MAIKPLMLRRSIDLKKREMKELRDKMADVEKREQELVLAIEEVENEEEMQAVQESVDKLNEEKENLQQSIDALDQVIDDLEKELEAAEADVPPPGAEPKEERSINTMNSTRNFFGMNMQERTAFVQREDVQKFLGETRACIKERRALNNVGLTVPQVMLGLLRENIAEYSKLYKHVNVRQIAGEGRQLIMGTIPEGVWTECCANLNELDLTFFDMTLDCYKVGGYFAVCNANLQDSDIDLAAEILTALGQAIGKALDKAILFGRNTATYQNMPQGIASRLIQESQPANYPATARTWQDLHSSNVKSIASTVTGAALISAIVTNSGAMKGNYSRGEKVWVMNEKTYTQLMAATVSVDANGRIVTGVSDIMPVVGGIIEVLEVVPDDMIVGGYYDLYTLGERAGNQFATSEHVRFLADQTVFRGIARYDGAPAIAEAFIIIMLNSGTAKTAVEGVTFGADEANTVQAIRINTSTATVPVSGTLQLYAITEPGSGEVVWTSGTPAKATVNSVTGVVTGVSTGTSVITATANGLTASCTVTVSAS